MPNGSVTSSRSTSANPLPVIASTTRPRSSKASPESPNRLPGSNSSTADRATAAAVGRPERRGEVFGLGPRLAVDARGRPGVGMRAPIRQIAIDPDRLDRIGQRDLAIVRVDSRRGHDPRGYAEHQNRPDHAPLSSHERCRQRSRLSSPRSVRPSRRARSTSSGDTPCTLARTNSEMLKRPPAARIASM